MKRFALDDLEEIKAASHATELHLDVQGLAGIVLMEVSVQRRAVTTVEGFEPGFEGAARRGIGNRGLRRRWSLGNRLRRQCDRQR